jgi:hypothetical protein
MRKMLTIIALVVILGIMVVWNVSVRAEVPNPMVGKWNVSIHCNSLLLDKTGNFEIQKSRTDQIWIFGPPEQYNWFGPNGYVSAYYVDTFDQSGKFLGSGFMWYYHDEEWNGWMKGYVASACSEMQVVGNGVHKNFSGTYNSGFGASRYGDYCSAVNPFPIVSENSTVQDWSCSMTITKRR